MKICIRFVMRFAFILTLFFLALSATHALNNKPEVFHSISLITAKQMASETGKHVFIEFYADWCVPCKWMEETTFNDQNVQQLLEKNYIAVRVDIDDFDGYVVKEQYEIQVLPTIIILDDNGRVLHRKEQSMTASMLSGLLTNEIPALDQTRFNRSPKGIDEVKNVAEQAINKPEYSPAKENPATVKTMSYRVQVGVFTDYANTQNFVKDLRQFTEEPIIVSNDVLHGKTVFKVFVGQFSKRQDANNFKNELWQNYGIEGFVK